MPAFPLRFCSCATPPAPPCRCVQTPDQAALTVCRFTTLRHFAATWRFMPFMVDQPSPSFLWAQELCYAAVLPTTAAATPPYCHNVSPLIRHSTIAYYTSTLVRRAYACSTLSAYAHFSCRTPHAFFQATRADTAAPGPLSACHAACVVVCTAWLMQQRQCLPVSQRRTRLAFYRAQHGSPPSAGGSRRQRRFLPT